MKIKSVGLQDFATIGTVAIWGSAMLLASGPSAMAQSSRDPWYQPFSNGSIWNTPVGTGAQFVAANLGLMGGMTDDVEYEVISHPTDPVHNITQPYSGGASLTEHVANGFMPLASGPGFTPNSCGSFLETDGISLRQYSPLQRANSTSDLTSYWFNGTDGPVWLSTNLYGPGIGGDHQAAQMSCLGGDVRKGEITDNNVNNPIRHALKIELDWHQLYQTTNTSDTANRNETYRWPATNSDGGALGSGGYSGTNSALRIGSLLAIPPTDSSGNPITESSLGLLTVPGRKIFHALQDYGAYVVDTVGNNYTGSNGGYQSNICFETGVDTDFQNAYGVGLSTYSGSSTTSWFADLNTIYQHLQVVNNNASTTVGGGGLARVIPPLPLNLAINPGFEDDGTGAAFPVGWNKYSPNGSADDNASYTENIGTSHGGGYQLACYRSTPYFTQQYQLITGVPNGNYILSAWVESSGGLNEGFMYAWRYADTSGGTTLMANLPATGNTSTSWQQISIPVTVTSGECEIGFRAHDTVGGGYIRADDVQFYPVTTPFVDIASAHQGSTIGNFIGDTYFSGGSTYNTSDTINTTATGAAPAGVYQNERYGTFSYTVPVTATPLGGSYTVKLHFAELWHGISGRGNDSGTGQRIFNVSINGTQVLTNFDIFATAGAADKAVVETFSGLQPNSSGNIVIGFTPVSTCPDPSAKVDGIEIFDPIGASGAPAVPANVKAKPGSGIIYLTWNPSATAKTYNVYRSTTSGSETLYSSGVGGEYFADKSVTAGTAYYYKVVAVGSGGSSALSTESSARP